MSSDSSRKNVILIVDDTPTNLEMLFDFLVSAGFKVLVACDGQSAVEKAQYALPDLILLDVVMPDIDGFEACRLLKANSSTQDIPVIFMTALSETRQKVEGLNLGAVDYITKPLQHEEVLARIKIHLSLRNLNKTLQEQNLRLEKEIQERLRSEEKIREQAALLDITTDAIFVRDLNNQILFWNQGAERLYKWKAQEAMGKNAKELLCREGVCHPHKHHKILMEKGEWQGELHQVTKENKDIIVASRWTLVRDEEGEPKSILTVNTDITEKKQLESQFLRSQRMESIGTLASGIAHDLNNALTPILGAVQLLAHKLPDEQSQRLLTILEKNTKRSAEFVKQVLSFARGVEGERTMLQVGYLILEIEQIAKQTFSRAIEICADIPILDLWTISGDATQLHQVLMNLCVNARDAMPKGGTLEISARNLWVDENFARLNIDAKVGPYVVISVSDTGTGIPKEIIDRVFEPFFTTKKLGKGTGLGLSTVIGIVKSHGGFINLVSELGIGTEFKVYLPATDATATESASTQTNQHELPSGQGELILVVDDEDSIRDITKISLEAYNYKVIAASDGVEAVALYAQHQSEISVVLVDIMMPVMDGNATIHTLQKINPQVKIIAVSGLMSGTKKIEVNGKSISNILPKPYSFEELLLKLHTVINN